MAKLLQQDCSSGCLSPSTRFLPSRSCTSRNILLSPATPAPHAAFTVARWPVTLTGQTPPARATVHPFAHPRAGAARVACTSTRNSSIPGRAAHAVFERLPQGRKSLGRKQRSSLVIFLGFTPQLVLKLTHCPCDSQTRKLAGAGSPRGGVSVLSWFIEILNNTPLNNHPPGRTPRQLKSTKTVPDQLELMVTSPLERFILGLSGVIHLSLRVVWECAYRPAGPLDRREHWAQRQKGRDKVTDAKQLEQRWASGLQDGAHSPVSG